MSYEITAKELVEAIKLSTGEDVSAENITCIKGFGIPTYVIDTGCMTYLCKKLHKGVITVKRVKWW